MNHRCHSLGGSLLYVSGNLEDTGKHGSCSLCLRYCL